MTIPIAECIGTIDEIIGKYPSFLGDYHVRRLRAAADLIERQKAAIEIAKKHLNSAGMHEMLFALTNKENTDD